MDTKDAAVRPTPVGSERKLAAILSADVVSYSRLMGEDEVGALRTLTAYRVIIDALIAQHHGRIVGTAGDSVLAEFASVVDAVQCAVEIQTNLRAANAPLPPERRMLFRIDINLGDVMVEGETIYGDGVNIAARLESLADPGGICLSGSVYEQIENKLPLPYEDLGEQTVKNIKKPVRVYRVKRDETVEAAHRPSAVGAARRSRSFAFARWGAAGLLLVTVAIVAVRYWSSPVLTPHSPIPNPQFLPLPDKPSIVIPPFVNMSDDPKQDYFSDGITEVLTSDLSRISSLFVIARNTAFTLKGKAINVQAIGKELGVRYVLEGSVQKAQEQVRIVVQLVDATTDAHLWAERFDRPLKNIFALQDEIVQKIVTTLKLQLTLQEQGWVMHKTTDNLEAYDAFLRGYEYCCRFTQEANAKGRQLYEKAVALDPRYAEAYAALGQTYLLEWNYQWSQDPQTLQRALELAQKAISIDDAVPRAHLILGLVYLLLKQYDQALSSTERAVALDPNFADSYALGLATIFSFVGRPAEAVGLVEKAMRLNPRSPPLYFFELGRAYRLLGRSEEAIAALKEALARNSNLLYAHFQLAGIYSELGREEEARAAAAEVLRLNPHFSLDVWRQSIAYKDPTIVERQLAAARKAGLK